jgi:pimeloyl-ACP methyl ester carboxylesterase
MLDTRFLAVTLILLSGACAPHQQPDLVRLYASVAEKPKTHPLIVIPGIMGSRLHRADGDREIWPGSLWKLMIAGDFDNLALTIPGSEAIAGAPRPAELETGGIFHEIAGEDFYAQIIETLSDAGGYTCVPREKVTAQSDCVLFAWDWREGMVAAARELDNLVERLRRLRADPSLRVDVVAHSAGGLVTRYFVRFGGVDVLDEIEPSITFAGGRKVRQAILIGTPNYGSITALQKAITGYRIGLTGMRPETTATMPGMFQLLPHPDRTWMIDIRGRRLDLDLYDVATWRRYRWSIWDTEVRERIRANFADPSWADAYLAVFEAHFERQLARAVRFHRSLSRPVAVAPTRYVVFGSACLRTPARCLLEEVDGRTHVWLDPKDIKQPLPGVPYEHLMVEPGDGSVTKASLLAMDSLDLDATRGDFPVAWAVFVCARHENLPANVTFQDNLLNIVLYGVK